MVTAYIDESGDLGRGGRYFVLAAAVYDTPRGEQRSKRIIKKEQQLIRRTSPNVAIEEIKSSHLAFSRRQRIINKITLRSDIDIYGLVIYKPNVALLREGRPKNLVYNYLAKLLTDMIFENYNDDFRIIFDQRCTGVKSMNSLPDYITINAYTRHNHVDKDVKVVQRDSKTMYNLQIADVIAGTIFQAYKKQSKHFLELLAPRVVKIDEFPRNRFDGSLQK